MDNAMFLNPNITDRVLLLAILICAIGPLVILESSITAQWPLKGGIWLNPINITAFGWLFATIIYQRRTRTRFAKWLFALFPLVFAPSVIIFLFWVWGHGYSK
jgi:hypothetical protein